MRRARGSATGSRQRNSNGRTLPGPFHPRRLQLTGLGLCFMDKNDLSFWAAMLGAAILRVATSPVHSFWRALLMLGTSIFIAWLLTDAVIDWLHLNAAVYRTPMAGLIALTADGLVRAVMRAAKDPLGTFLAVTGRKKED